METNHCTVSEEEFVEACRTVVSATFLLQESRTRFRKAIVQGALIEAGTSLPAFVVGGIMEAILSSGLFAVQIAPHMYEKLFGHDVDLLEAKYHALEQIISFCRKDMDRALSLSRETGVLIVPAPSGDPSISLRP